MSATRKRYFIRLFARCLIFVICLILCFVNPQVFDILEGANFFKKISAFHLLWLVWIVDMFLQIVPIKNKIALGSQKLFANRFQPIREKINQKALKDYILTTTNLAYRVFILWGILISVIGILFYMNYINKTVLFITHRNTSISVCDSIIHVENKVFTKIK